MSPDPFDLSAADDPRPDEGAGYEDAWRIPEAAGPAFHDDLAGPEPEAPEVAEATVRQYLDLVGLGLNYTLPGRNYGIEDAWRMDAQDLDTMTPPATRILNRRPALRAIAARADVDAVTLLAALARYAFTNAAEVVQARRDAEGERPHLGGRDQGEAPEDAGGPAWPGLTGVPSR